jgi:hypothetical protein
VPAVLPNIPANPLPINGILTSKSSNPLIRFFRCLPVKSANALAPSSTNARRIAVRVSATNCLNLLSPVVASSRSNALPAPSSTLFSLSPDSIPSRNWRAISGPILPNARVAIRLASTIEVAFLILSTIWSRASDGRANPCSDNRLKASWNGLRNESSCMFCVRGNRISITPRPKSETIVLIWRLTPRHARSNLVTPVSWRSICL